MRIMEYLESKSAKELAGATTPVWVEERRMYFMELLCKKEKRKKREKARNLCFRERSRYVLLRERKDGSALRLVCL